jgi:hypothetical protein
MKLQANDPTNVQVGLTYIIILLTLYFISICMIIRAKHPQIEV